MNKALVLTGKHALIFGAGGSFGSVVAREFADGGTAHAAVVDAEDPEAVDAYVDRIAGEAGTIDVVFNLMGPRLTEYGGGKSATQLSVEEFMAPLVRLVKSQFITSRAAARRVIERADGRTRCEVHPAHRAATGHSPA